MITKVINVNLHQPIYERLTAKQGDIASRYLLFHLLDGDKPFDLSNRTVRVYAIKPDKTEIFNDLTINDASKGYCTLELTSQCLAEAGIVKMELYISQSGKVLTSIPFELEVIGCINTANSVVSTNEFSALEVALGSLQDYYNLRSEIVQARKGYGTVGKRLDNFDSQLDNNTRQSVIKKINPKLLPPPYTRAIGDGVTNDTVAFNTALDLLCTRSDSNIIFETRCGVLELDEGVYVVDEILCRSNLTIRGQGMGKTILIPNINDIDKFFLDVKYTGESKLCNFELENLSILKTPSHQFAIEPVTGRQECSILNLTKCTSVRIRNVIISGFKGNGILFKESFDTNIDNLQMIGCGDETHDAIMITSSESDGSNALHFNAIRVEGCSAINIEATGDRFNREIQFIGGKYEHVPLKIQGSSNVNFCGGHFTYGKTNIPLLRIRDTSEAETYGVNFTGCSFIGTNTGYLANITSRVNPKFVGCSFKGFAKGFVGDNITLCTNEFYNMTAPIINSVANISADNNEFIYTGGTDGEYLFRIGSNSNFNCNKIKYNANEKLNGCLISGDGNHMTFNSFLTCDTGIRVEGSLNLLFGNKGSISEKEGVLANTLGHFSSLYVPTNSLDIPQNIRFNPTTNKLELFRKSNNSWGETYVRAGKVSNLATGSTLETTITKINEILTALKNANIMVP